MLKTTKDAISSDGIATSSRRSASARAAARYLSSQAIINRPP
jgi:hypothetical protein